MCEPTASRPPPPSLSDFTGFLWPLTLTNLLQALSGTLSSIFLGRMLGPGALAVAGSFFPILFLVISFVIGLGAGASVLAARAHGAGDSTRIRDVAGTAVAAATVGGVVLAGLGALAIGPLLGVLGTPDALLPDAVAYARAMLMAMPVIFGVLLLSALLRGVGDTRTPLVALAITCASNLVAGPVLLGGLGGWRGLGIEGAGLATLLSSAAGLAWMAGDLRRRRHVLAPGRALLAHVRLDGPTLGEVFRIGVPAGVQVVLLALAELAVLGAVNRFGEAAVAAYGAVNQVVAYVQFPAVSVAVTASILGAHAIGAGRPEHLPAIARRAMRLNLAITGGLIVMAYLGGRTLLGLFLRDVAVVLLAERILQLTLWSHLLFTSAGVLVGVMRATGVVWAPTLLSLVSIVCVEVPVAYLLARPFGLDGVWFAYPAAFATLLLLQAVYFHRVWAPGHLCATA